MLHGVPLNPLLRPDVGETVTPRTSELFLKQREQLGFPLGVDSLLAPWSVVRLQPCTVERRVVRGLRSTNSMRTVIRLCLSHERSWRSLLRRAEPLSLSTFIMSPDEVGLERKPQESGTLE